MSRKPFDTVLIANRGEIAVRIADVLRSRGIRSIAVYSEADAEAPHVKAADVAVPIGESAVRESYLVHERILAAAMAHGAQAIHPGYGLLSENADFARSCEAAGIVFIGPSPEVIDQMGDKAVARSTAEAAGVPVVPGSDGPVEDADAEALAETLGYPVLVKAAAGGGGIGMQVVKKANKLQKALQSCRDRGASSFGNPTVYLEKYIEAPRHIEIQVLFDHHGHGIHLFERECTLQRRHQKVVEEAPSVFVQSRPALRDALYADAVRAAASIGYRNAGTVEFIVDAEGNHFFIEMNTRLQVEHPVTEAITGVDLISWQLDIAAGRRLTITQADLAIDGHAVECRLYAEDPAKHFMPQPGRIDTYVPPTGEGIRVDSGVGPDQDVTPYYDPMLAKIMGHAPDRATALARTGAALAAFEIAPLVTNRAFLVEVLAHPHVQAGEFDTSWLERFAKGKL
ncbi:MAG: acetyl-CoA carboxylase biotin carboxylase subunit [Bradymonadia bacterium]|jgi:acetyl-CoA carboxylase biotin carboxylase subunit